LFLFGTRLTLLASISITRRLLVLVSIYDFCDADISGQVVVFVCLEESQEMDEIQKGISILGYKLTSPTCNPIQKLTLGS
jgi:hypothetical protein